MLSKVKAFIRKIVGPSRMRKLRRLFAPLVNATYDFQRFYSKSSASTGQKTRLHKRANLTFDYHKIEKGLALPDPRLGFGNETIRDLIRNTSNYEASYGPDDTSIAVRAVLKSYQNAQSCLEDNLPELSSFLESEMENTGVEFDRVGHGGVLSFTRETFFSFDHENARKFLTSRRSVRNMTGLAISEEKILEAVRLAQCAPSVCNRQSCRVYASNNPDIMREMLSYQNGNRGFGHTLGAVFIVVADLEAFRTIGERNQPYVDGGIFAMALVQGLHAMGLGACMLNWSVEKTQDQALRRTFDIPDSQVVITMVGAGYVADEFKVAASPRLPVHAVMKVLKA